MGTGVSVDAVPSQVSKQSAQELLGDKFDEAKFDAIANSDGLVEKAAFLDAIATVSPADASAVDAGGAASEPQIRSPNDVLNFWFDGAFHDEEALAKKEEKLREKWFGAKLTPEGPKPVAPEVGKAFDAECCKFVDTIKAAALGELGEEWDSEDGLYAKVIMFDQLTRNIFRGTADAFAYDKYASECVQKIMATDNWKSWGALSKLMFLGTVGQHSEDLAAHERTSIVCDVIDGKFEKFGKMYRNMCKEHTDIVRQFGRYECCFGRCP